MMAAEGFKSDLPKKLASCHDKTPTARILLKTLKCRWSRVQDAFTVLISFCALLLDTGLYSESPFFRPL